MRKPLLIICFCALFADNGFAQRDTAVKRRVILKVNPVNSFIGAREIGACIQIPLGKGLDIQLGFGKNTTQPSYKYQGYTARLGFYHFFNEIHFISLQFLYRQWKDYNVFFYGPASPNQQNVAELDESFSNTNDPIINPYSEVNPVSTNISFSTAVDNATINVFAFDLLYGKQAPLFHLKHFVFEDYIGGGFRIKAIALQQLYYIFDNISITSSKRASYTTLVPDVKFGIMVGYKF